MKNDLNIASLRKRYLAGELQPLAVMQDILARIGDDPHHVWIHRLSLAEIGDYVSALQDKDPADAAFVRHSVCHQGQHRSGRCADHGRLSRVCLSCRSSMRRWCNV